MIETFNSHVALLNKLQGQKDLLIKQRDEAKTNVFNYEAIYNNVLKAREVVQIVAQNTQKKIEMNISYLVTKALAAVFPEPWEFKLRFVQRRNRTEADLVFIKNGNETTDIFSDGGGGVVNVSSMALVFAVWSLKKTRNTIILDEPTHFLHSPYFQEKASALLKEISNRFNLQLIVVTDQENLIKSADKGFKISNRKGLSYVEEV